MEGGSEGKGRPPAGGRNSSGGAEAEAEAEAERGGAYRTLHYASARSSGQDHEGFEASTADMEVSQ